MTQQALIVVILMLLIGAATVALLLDRRQRRIERQVETLVSVRPTESAPSIRRVQTVSGRTLLYRLFNYNRGLDLGVRPQFVLLFGVAPAAVALYICAFLEISPGLTLLAMLGTWFLVVRGVFGWLRRRLANSLFRQLPDAIEIVNGAVRSGLPVAEAFRVLAREMPQPTAGQFAIVCSEMGLGRSMEDAIEDVCLRTGVAEYGFFAVTLSVQVKAGGSLAQTLSALADTVRSRVTLAGRAKALAGEVIFSSQALSLAPFIVGGVLYLINPSMVDLLFTDPFGKKLLTFAGVSILLGTLIIRYMVRRDTAI